jgi:hypothetical protein
VRTSAARSACARSEDHGIGEEHPASAVVDAEPVAAEDAAIMDEQARDVDVVAYRHADLLGPAHERPLDLPAGVVAREAGSPVPMSAEEALRQPPVSLAPDLRTPANQVLDPGRRLAA